MSIIVDANCASDLLSANPSEDFKPVLDAVVSKGARISYGGSKLKREYMALPAVWRFVVALDRAGKARAHPDAAIDALEQALSLSGALKSDDPHIIALAQVSGARLLCSRDKALHQDFLAKELIDKPRGSVYQNSGHAKLLRTHCER